MARGNLLERGWREARESKIAYWRSLTPSQKQQLADELRRSVQERRPDWPSRQQREEDLANHVRVAELLRRVKAPRKR